VTRSIVVLGLSFMVVVLFSGCVAHNAADDMKKRKEDLARKRALEPSYIAQYDVSLIEVQRPASAQARFGDMKITSPDLTKSLLIAEDQLMRIIWSGPDAQLGFALLNKSESPMKILWDEAAFVDITGQSKRVIHNGVKLTDRNSPQTPSVITSQGKLNDMVYPSDNVSFSSGQYGGWSQMPMFPCTREGYVCSDLNRKLVTVHTGLDYRILLPVEVNKESYPYTFVFKVNKAEVVTVKKGGEEGNAPK